MIRTLFLTVSVLALMFSVSPARADMFPTTVKIFKSMSYTQTTPTEVVPESRPYSFLAIGQGVDISSFYVVFPTSGKTDPVRVSEVDYSFLVSYLYLSPLNTAYPSGTYTVRFQNYDEPRVTFNLPLTDRAFPAAPKVKNFAATQTIDASKDFVLKWNKFTEAGSKGKVLVAIRYEGSKSAYAFFERGLGNPLPGTAEGITIPAGTLSSDETYTLTISFALFDFRGTTEGIINGCGTQSTLSLTIKTVEGSPAP